MAVRHAQKMLNLDRKNGGYYTDNISYIHNKPCYKFKEIKTQDLKWNFGKQNDIQNNRFLWLTFIPYFP